MNTEKSKILVIVEGEKTDVELMAKLFDIYGISHSHRIVPYRTNIYLLYDAMFKDNDPESMDIQQILKEREHREDYLRILNDRYTDILLIFDFDPQDPRYTKDKITAMANFFTESSDMGKLYINYPMVEAFYHMKAIPDLEFYSYTATLDELRRKKYKDRVVRENRNHQYMKTAFAATKTECNTVIKQNMQKARQIIGYEEDIYNGLLDSLDILHSQINLLEREQVISVLCTCVFYIAEYNNNLIMDAKCGEE